MHISLHLSCQSDSDGLCAAPQRVHHNIIIGGDGPKNLLLEVIREFHQLHGQVGLLGAVPHDQVRDVSECTDNAYCDGDIIRGKIRSEIFPITNVQQGTQNS